jgi:3-hydroxyisobutyrate dehydrogenase
MFHPVPGVRDIAASTRDYNEGFAVSLIKKDMRLANEASRSYGITNVLGEICQEDYEELERLGHGNKDFALIYKALEEKILDVDK